MVPLLRVLHHERLSKTDPSFRTTLFPCETTCFEVVVSFNTGEGIKSSLAIQPAVCLEKSEQFVQRATHVFPVLYRFMYTQMSSQLTGFTATRPRLLNLYTGCSYELARCESGINRRNESQQALFTPSGCAGSCLCCVCSTCLVSHGHVYPANPTWCQRIGMTKILTHVSV